MEIQDKNIKIEIAQSDNYQRIADIYNEYILLGNATMQDSLYDGEKIKSWVDHFNDRERLYVLKKEILKHKILKLIDI